MLIYKVLRAAEWFQLLAAGHSAGSPADHRDGFVHFSTAEQLSGTLERHFRNETDLTLLACEAASLGSALRWEPSRDGALFPHLYRDLRPGDIAWSRDLPLTPDGHRIGALS